MQSKYTLPIFEHADLARIHQQITGSYPWPTDLVSELVQNAVDSTVMSRRPGRRIVISYAPDTSTLEVWDNGLGIDSDTLKSFALGRTEKENKDYSDLPIAGYKGVGTTFVLAVSRRLEVEGIRKGERVLAECVDAARLIEAREEPQFEVVSDNASPGEEPFARILVQSDKADYLPWQSIDDLVGDLRTYTAIGCTRGLFGEACTDLDVEVRWLVDGKEVECAPVQPVYRFPSVDLPDLIVPYDRASERDRWQGRILLWQDAQERIVACFFGDREMIRKNGYRPGVTLSRRGTPASVDVKPPATGYAGYWENVVMLVDDEVELDVGRKSVKPGQVRRIQEKARTAFNRLMDHYQRFAPRRDEAVEIALNELRHDAQSLPILPTIEGVCYLREPADEQGVIGLFHELIGAGALPWYRTIAEWRDATIDALVEYSVPADLLGDRFKRQWEQSRRKTKDKRAELVDDVWIEFKKHACDLARDKKKDLRLVRLLVAWAAGDTLPSGWTLTPVPPADGHYIGASWELRAPNGDTCPVMLLSEVVELVANGRLEGMFRNENADGA